MRILLINPPCRTPSMIPLGLGYVASVLRKSGHDITLKDYNVEKKDFIQIGDDLDRAEYDVLGIGGLTTTYGFVKKVSDISKRLRPKAPVIAGNMVSTAYPELLLSN